MKNKRILMIAALLIALALPLFAVQATVDWQWEMNDPDVQYFRYQLDSESEDGWTVVPADVLSYSQSGLDGSRSYTLYLQQSYDGINWSASASAASEPAVPSEAEFVAEPVVTEEAAEAPVVEEVIPVEEETVEVEEVVVPETEESVEIAPVAPAAVAEDEGTFKFTLGFAGGIGMGINNDLDLDARLSLQLGFEDIVASDVLGFDIRLNIGAVADPVFGADEIFDNIFKLDRYRKSLYADLLIGGNVKFGSAQLYLGLGGEFVADYGHNADRALFDAGNFNFNVVPTALLGLRYNVADWFYIGLEGQYILDMDYNSDDIVDSMIHTVVPRLMFGFSF